MAKKSALLIGINKYPGLKKSAQLRGCHNDVLALKSVLEQKFEFPPENISILLDSEATRSNIFDAMKTVLDNCSDNDHIVFLFSGHGSRLKARRKNKASGWYETIMPFDSGRQPLGVNIDITDDEILDWLTALSRKTSNIVLIFDSCYAGSIIRDDDFQTGLRGIPPDDSTIREAAAPIFSGGFDSDVAGFVTETGRSGWLPLSNKYVLFAACAEHERAHLYKEETGEEVIEYGVLSYFLCRALWEARSGATYRDVWDQVYLTIKSRFEKQNAQLEGNRDRELFGLEEFPPSRFLLVSEKTGDKLILNGGILLGVTLNSHWAVYPPGTKYPGQENANFTTVKTISVSTTKTEAVVIGKNEKDNVLTPGSRAFETSSPKSESCLKIWIGNNLPEHKERFDKLASDLRRSALIKLTDREELADIRIYLQNNHENITADLAGDIRKAVWCVYGYDKSPLMRPQTNTESIVRNLEQVSRYRRILDLRNPKSEMAGKIDFVILRQNDDLSWDEIEPQEIEQKTVITEGERIALKIVNHFDSPVFFSILDLGLSKRVSLLYPPPGASVIIGAYEKQTGGISPSIQGKGVFTIGISGNEYLELSFPKSFPYAETENPLNEGLEIFKLIVTTRPHDLSFLTQEAMRTASVPKSPVEYLVVDSLRGNEMFDKDPLADNENEWLAIEKYFYLKRKKK